MNTIENAMTKPTRLIFETFSTCECKDMHCTACYPVTDLAPKQDIFTIDDDNSAALDEALRLSTELSLKITQLEIKIKNLEMLNAFGGSDGV